MISVDLPEWARVSPTADVRLRGFRIEGSADRELARCLAEQRVLEISGRDDGLAVRSFSHVGRIELGGITITVRPKLAANSLLELLRYAYSLRDLRLLSDASFATGEHGLQDLVIAQLQSEARELIHRGVARRYVRRSEELASPRGRIDVGRMARQRNPAATAVSCTHHPRSSDFLLNQVVRAGLELARSLALAPFLRRGIAQTAAIFAELASPLELSAAILRMARRRLDRLSATYAPILRLVEILYDSSCLDLGQGATTVRLNGFLFDMNRFFQALVGKFLRESLPNCRVQSEVSLRGMMTYAPGFNPLRRRSPLPRPDFVVMRGREEKFLLDAKYRDLWRTELPREMLYQLGIYAMSQPRGATAAILYPTEDPAATEAIIDIKEPTTEATRAHVALRPVVIPQLLALLGTSASGERDRQTLASALAFGTVSRG
jgi:5-methylcytosine-specific restriction enzyme subunit McrC